jgi:Fe2+ transport system protein FeoA
MPEPDPVASQMTLADVSSAATYTVLGVDGEDALSRRLEAHGFWPGSEVEWIVTALGGDPMLFWLHGYRLALRREEARRIRVLPAAPGQGEAQ